MLLTQAVLRVLAEPLLRRSSLKGQTYRTVLDQSEAMRLILSSTAVSMPLAQLVQRSTLEIFQRFETG
jgi:hypothetical protein